MKKTVQAFGVFVLASLFGARIQAGYYHVRNKSKSPITVRFESGKGVKSMVVPAGKSKFSLFQFRQPEHIIIDEHAGEIDEFGRPVYSGAETTIDVTPSKRLWKRHTIVYDGPGAYDYKQGLLR